MDPDAALEKIRELVAEWRANDDTGDATGILDDLVDHIAGLDDWLANQGMLPDAWANGPYQETI